MTDRIPVAVLGATGYVGQHLVRLLAGHPEFELVQLAGGDRSVRRPLGELWQLPETIPPAFAETRISPLRPQELSRAGVRAAFSALPSGTAGVLEDRVHARGISVFTNAADHRYDDGVPLLIPEVNPAHLAAKCRPGRALLVANPNCTATGLALALAPVWAALAPKELHVATYQALSGAGLSGVSSLAATDNVVPFIDGEEEKVESETRTILAPVRGGRIRPLRLPVLTHCARVPVRDGHLEAVTVVAARRPARAVLERAWREFDPLRADALPTAPSPPVHLRPERDRPQPVLDRSAGTPGRAAGMAAAIGRIRWEPPYLRFFVLTHNAIRGAAGGALLNAEFARSRGFLPP